MFLFLLAGGVDIDFSSFNVDRGDFQRYVMDGTSWNRLFVDDNYFVRQGRSLRFNSRR